jgi:4-hydroxy-3-polyprenylbenzoate decarboxylase
LEKVRDLILGVSGASGTKLAFRALMLFGSSPDVETLHLVVSRRAIQVAQEEVGPEIGNVSCFVDAARLDDDVKRKLRVHPSEALDSPIASGSFRTLGMAVLPCSVGTMASIAGGLSRGLLQRAADVCLKERRRLVLGVRETPLSEIHAENLLRVTRAGAIVAPVVPAFYAVRTLDEALDAYLERVADLLAISIPTGGYRYKEKRS